MTPNEHSFRHLRCPAMLIGALRNGRITSWIMVLEALKIRLSSVEMSSMSISRQNSPQIPGGKMARSASGVIFWPKPILYFCCSS